MNKHKFKKGIIITTIVAISLGSVGFCTYKYNKIQSYNNLINNANKYMEESEYDKAIALFSESLNSKKDPNIEISIKLAKNLKEIKIIYDEGIKLANDKKYLEAIKKFKNVTKENDKLYNNAQNKIDECKKKYIAQNLASANNAAKNANYNEANKYLDSILKIDTNNKDAQKLKNTFANAIRKKQSEEKLKEKLVVSKPKNKILTQEDAINILKDKFPFSSSNPYYRCASEDDESYLIHITDERPTHSATLGWYKVYKHTGRIYNDIMCKYEN